jgi:hypothetical protein
MPHWGSLSARGALPPEYRVWTKQPREIYRTLLRGCLPGVDLQRPLDIPPPRACLVAHVVPHQGHTVEPAVAKARVRCRLRPFCVRGFLVSWWGRREPQYATLGSAPFKSSVIRRSTIYHVCAFFYQYNVEEHWLHFLCNAGLPSCLRQI